MGTYSHETKRFGMFLAIATIAFALFFAGTGTVLDHASGAQSDNVVAPAELSDADYNSLKEVALNDARVKEIIGDQPYEVMSYDFFSNANDDPVVWYPELHINVDNKTQITAVVGLDENVAQSFVTRVITSPMMPSAQAVGDDDGHGYAINYYTGGSTIDGLKLTTTAPTVEGEEQVDLYWGLNAIELNAVDSRGCNPAYYDSSYFAQTGFVWLVNGYIIWTDTGAGCATQVTAVSGSAGDDFEFKIYVDSSNRWVMYGKNLDNSEQFIKTRSGIDYLVMKTSNYNTSVFMESSDSTIHGDQIGSPSGTVKLSTNGGSSWSNWSSAARVDQTCTGTDNTYPYNSSKEVISGNLAGGSTATWNPIRMDTYYSGC